MFIKCVIFLTILVLLIQDLEAKSQIGSGKKIRCFNPDKPQDMPDDVYEKYKIASKHLNENDKKDFWAKFANWWKNVFAQIGKFFEKVGKFFKNLFSNKKNKQAESTTPMTEAPPTPSPKQANNNKNVIICVEEESKDNNDVVTTKIYEVDVTTAATESIVTLMTTLTTTEELMTTVGTEKVEITTYQEPTTYQEKTTRAPDSTPFDPSSDTKEKGPVIDGVENKAEIKKKDNEEAVIVRAV